MIRKITIFTILMCFIFNVFSQIDINITGMWKDDNIDLKIKDKIKKLNNQFVEGFTQSKPDTVFKICSEKLLETGKNDLKMVILQMGKKYSKEDFKILNEFYNISTSKNSSTRVFTGISGEHDYTIGFKSINKESYISVGYFNEFPVQMGFTLIYGKYNDEWKLNIIQIGILRIMDRDAYDWFLLAKNEYEKGYLINAVNNISLAGQILKPAKDIWHYQKEDKIIKFNEKVRKEINSKYTFPLTVEYVETKPQIYRIYPQGMSEGFFPMIEYKTEIELSDTIRLAKENDEIHSKISKLFKGIDKGTKMIFYSASNMIPIGYKPVETYRFIKYIKEE